MVKRPAEASETTVIEGQPASKSKTLENGTPSARRSLAPDPEMGEFEDEYEDELDDEEEIVMEKDEEEVGEEDGMRPIALGRIV